MESVCTAHAPGEGTDPSSQPTSQSSEAGEGGDKHGPQREDVTPLRGGEGCGMRRLFIRARKYSLSLRFLQMTKATLLSH
uniref:Uncharacterized protein n=1 Tax=Knipowitschia caucasica TaxID=637954 RepID=A0AAV2LGF9_KNICA